MLQIIVQRVVIMFIMVVVGFASGKTGILTAEHNRGISGILINVCLPCMCISGFQQELNAETLNGLLMSLIIAVIMYTVIIIGSRFFIRKKNTYEYGISRHAAIYGNAGFMGIPIIEPLLGSVGVLYATLHVAIINSVGFIQGDHLISDGRKFKFSQVLNMPMAGVAAGLLLFLLQISIPSVVLSPIKTLGNMVTPMAMLMTGVSLSAFDPKHISHVRDILKVSLFRLVLAPLAMILICALLPMEPAVKLVAIIVAACPSLSFTLVLSIRENKDSLYASEIISVTTILFMVTLPLLMLLCGALGISI